MMSAAQPGFEIGKHEMNDGQKGFRDLHIASLRDGGVVKAVLAQLRVAAPVVGDNGCSRHHGVFDKAAQRLGASVGHNRESDTTGVPPGLALVEAAVTLALADFDGASHKSHIMDAVPLSARAPTHESFIGFDVFTGIAADPILIRPHHADAQLVKNLKGCFVTRQPELPLKLNGRYAGCLAGEQVCRPEPHRERRVSVFHDRACHKARIAATLPATEYARSSGDAIRFADCAATSADKSVVPPGAFKIGRARRFVRKQALKLRQRARKRQIASLKNIDRHDRSKSVQVLNMLHLVTVCDNPISTGLSSAIYQWVSNQNKFTVRFRSCRIGSRHEFLLLVGDKIIMSKSWITPRWPLVPAILLATWAPACHALTYQEALDIAESRASELKARQNTVSAAQAARISAGELPDPKLVMGVDNLPVQGSEAWSTTRDFMTMQRVGVMQEVTNGDKREAVRQLADTKVARADAELEIERLSVKRQTRLAWLKVYFLQQQQALLDQIEAENHMLSTAVTARLAAGQGKGSDSLQSRQESIALEDRRDDLERDLSKARADLARWVGAIATEPLTGPPPAYTPNPEHLRHNLDRHPDIAIFGIQEDSGRAEVNLAKAAKKSDWAVELDYEHRAPLFGDMISVQFTFDLPIFAKTRQNPQIAAREQELERVSAERESMVRDHMAQLEALLAEQTALVRQIDRIDQDWLPLGQQKVDLTLAEYRSGQEPLTSVLDARKFLIDTRMKRIDLAARRAAIETELSYLSEEMQP
ncbi:Outer membrane efflux protein (modular protein) [mine drainage metagenome]|uniref:Outer membrane efflux protein (Modular protein) n=1 Tax=mine drainage metagenome TaxID=410659 RepID=A0A3P3ZQW9_9ZZZZ